jgi:hypothetical protein
VSSVARPSSWLIVAAGLAVYATLVWALPAARWPEAPLPGWLAQAGVPIVYGILVGVFMRRASWPRFLGAIALLWVGHLLVGALTGGVTAWLLPSSVDPATSAWFPPPPLPQFLWVPLLLIPLHDLIVGDPRSRRGGRVVRLRSLGPDGRAPIAASMSPAAAPVSPVAPVVVSTKPVTTEPRERRGDANARPVSLAHAESMASRIGPTSSTSPASATAIVEPPPTRPVLDEMLARETSADVVRVSFARIADQFPAAAFNLPLDRMAASLLEPGYLLVPQRLVVAQLAEGLVRAGWETVAEQFPRHLLALSDAEITRRLREGQLVLPLDELVPQLPSELFRVVGPLVNLEGIDSFPEPFKAIGHEPDERLAAPFAEAVSASVAEAPVVTDPQLPSATSEPLEDEAAAPVGASAPPTDEPTEPPPSGAEGAESVVSPEHELVEEGLAAPVVAWAPPMMQIDEPAPPSRNGGDAVVATVPGPESLVAPGERPAAAPAGHAAHPRVAEPVDEPVTELTAAAPPVQPARPDDLIEAREIAALLAPVGPLNAAVAAEDGVVFLIVSSPGLSAPATVATARSMLPILADGRAPWPIEQLTLRGPEGALVLTPLQPMCSEGRVLVAAVPPQGSLALLEILCRRVAARHAGPPPAQAAGGHDADLLEVEPTSRMRDVAVSLHAVGVTSASAFRNPAAETVLCLFLSAESDARAIAGFTHELGRAMREAGGLGVPTQSALVRGGACHLMLRLPDLARGCADIIVAVGGRIDRPGLAYRQLESAAHALRAG